jgi:NitT/TauT family transport system ATP-binding protein
MDQREKAFLSVKGVSKVYKTRARELLALEDVSFDMRANEFVSLVGRSGCGKSTLLNIVAGLLEKTSGSVTIGDQEITEPQSYIGVVFQTPVLLPWRSTIENLMLPVEILGLDKEKYRPRAIELLRLTGLAEFEDAPPRSLSGGMQQRAAICRALVYDPPVLLMDEPFGALDAMTREELNVELLRIWQEKKKAVIFVTHSISEAVFLSDRVIVMTPRPGRIKKIFDIDLPRPRDMTVRGNPAFGKYELEIRKEIFGV